MNQIESLLHDLSRPAVLYEVALALACLGAAWALVARLGRGAAPDSIWFGRHRIDGLLMPLLALALVYGARLALAQLQPVVLLRILVPVLLSLAAIRLFARVLSAAFPVSRLAYLVERLFSWMAWGVAVLWIAGWLPLVLLELESIGLGFGKTQVSLRTVIEGILSAGLVLVLALWLSAAIERRVLSEAVQDLSMRRVAGNALRAALLFVGLLVALSAVGVDLTALSVLGGALGVGLGFGLQKLAANYVSGFVILLERSLRIGDSVRVDGFEGRITDIKTRYTLVRAASGRESVVPNEMLITQRVENLALAERKFPLTCNVTVGHDSDVAQVQSILARACASCKRVLADPAPVALLANIGPDGLEFTLSFNIADPDNGQLNVRSDVNIAMLNGLRAANIGIAQTQRVLRTLA
jgi:small-conductance mechanosensitive channel